MNTLNAYVGAVFTPIKWAKWVIGKYNLLERWLQGATFLDPACGDGAFLRAFISLAKERNIKAHLPIENLFGFEIEKEFIQNFKQKLEPKDLRLIKNIKQLDFILENPDIRVDYLVGNPPWINYSDLHDSYKDLIRTRFIEYRLAQKKTNLLLGNSRVDLSALFVTKSIVDNLNSRGQAFFFLPLSLILNDGAHNNFRQFCSKGRNFYLNEVYDFADFKISESISTRYGLASFRVEQSYSAPRPYFTTIDRISWKKSYAHQFGLGKAYHILDSKNSEFKYKQISLRKSQKPRQGINTCGANRLLIFSDCKQADEKHMQVITSMGGIKLENNLLFPVITKKNFEEVNPKPSKWALLPYSSNGKPLSIDDLKRLPLTYEYLESIRHDLTARKGTLINSLINKNYYYAWLGVNDYAFARAKLVWSAYGTDMFKAKVFTSFNGKSWQANQALQAYIPCQGEAEALNLLSEIEKSGINEYLKAFQMQGTRSFAQPGRIADFFKIINESIAVP